MPELPEVESIARSLAADGLVGRRVQRARVGWARTIAAPSARAFTSRVRGQRVTGVGRRGKFVKIDLDQDRLLIHLRMSGDLLLGKSVKPLGSYSRMELYFEDGTQLSFNDPRKFGRAWLLADAESLLGALGPEPLDPALTPSCFHKMLAERKRQLKPLLLDQAFLAGLGNIYADEALWEGRLHPLRPASRVSRKQSAALLAGIRKVLKAGIKRNGASIDWVYQGGEFQNYFRVYQRTGEKCPRCGAKIKRMVLGQRGTHYCPKCQRR